MCTHHVRMFFWNDRIDKRHVRVPIGQMRLSPRLAERRGGGGRANVRHRTWQHWGAWMSTNSEDVYLFPPFFLFFFFSSMQFFLAKPQYFSSSSSVFLWFCLVFHGSKYVASFPLRPPPRVHFFCSVFNFFLQPFGVFRAMATTVQSALPPLSHPPLFFPSFVFLPLFYSLCYDFVFLSVFLGLNVPLFHENTATPVHIPFCLFLPL